MMLDKCLPCVSATQEDTPSQRVSEPYPGAEWNRVVYLTYAFALPMLLLPLLLMGTLHEYSRTAALLAVVASRTSPYPAHLSLQDVKRVYRGRRRLPSLLSLAHYGKKKKTQGPQPVTTTSCALYTMKGVRERIKAWEDGPGPCTLDVIRNLANKPLDPATIRKLQACYDAGNQTTLSVPAVAAVLTHLRDHGLLKPRGVALFQTTQGRSTGTRAICYIAAEPSDVIVGSPGRGNFTPVLFVDRQHVEAPRLQRNHCFITDIPGLFLLGNPAPLPVEELDEFHDRFSATWHKLGELEDAPLALEAEGAPPEEEEEVPYSFTATGTLVPECCTTAAGLYRPPNIHKTARLEPPVALSTLTHHYQPVCLPSRPAPPPPAWCPLPIAPLPADGPPLHLLGMPVLPPAPAFSLAGFHLPPQPEGNPYPVPPSTLSTNSSWTTGSSLEESDEEGPSLDEFVDAALSSMSTPHRRLSVPRDGDCLVHTINTFLPIPIPPAEMRLAVAGYAFAHSNTDLVTQTLAGFNLIEWMRGVCRPASYLGEEFLILATVLYELGPPCVVAVTSRPRHGPQLYVSKDPVGAHICALSTPGHWEPILPAKYPRTIPYHVYRELAEEQVHTVSALHTQHPYTQYPCLYRDSAMAGLFSPEPDVVWYLPVIPRAREGNPGYVQCPCREGPAGLEVLAPGVAPDLSGWQWLWANIAALYHHGLSFNRLAEEQIGARCCHGLHKSPFFCPECHGFPVLGQGLTRRLAATVGDNTVARYVDCGPTNPATAYALRRKWGVNPEIWLSTGRLPYVTEAGELCFVGRLPGIMTTLVVAEQPTPEGTYYWERARRGTLDGLPFYVLVPRFAALAVVSRSDLGAAGREACSAFIPPPTRHSRRLRDGRDEVTYTYEYADLTATGPLVKTLTVTAATQTAMMRYIEAVPTCTLASVARTVSTSTSLSTHELRTLASLLLHSSVTMRKKEYLSQAYYGRVTKKERHRLHGDAVTVEEVDGPVRKTCLGCGGAAPLRYRWRHGMCPLCHSVWQLSLVGVHVHPFRLERAAPLHVLEARRRQLGPPLGRHEVRPTCKDKPVLEEFDLNEKEAEERWAYGDGPGMPWAGPRGQRGPLPEAPPFYVPPKTRCPTEPRVAVVDVGVVCRRKAVVFTSEVETINAAVKYRLFLKPVHAPDPTAWDHLKRSALCSPALHCGRGETVVPLHHAAPSEIEEAVTRGWFPAGLLPTYFAWEAQRQNPPGQTFPTTTHHDLVVCIVPMCHGKTTMAALYPHLFQDVDELYATVPQSLRDESRATGRFGDLTDALWKGVGARLDYGRVLLAHCAPPLTSGLAAHTLFGIEPLDDDELNRRLTLRPADHRELAFHNRNGLRSLLTAGLRQVTWETLLSWEPEAPNSWMSSFPPARRQSLWTSLAMYLQEGDDARGLRLPGSILDEHNGHAGWREEWGEFTMFPKRELAPNDEPGEGTVHDCAPTPANPRAIQAPHDVAHNIWGPYSRAATQRLHSKWHSGKPIFYTSGSKPAEMDAWINRFAGADGNLRGRWVDHRIMATDYSAYDCTHSTFSFEYVEGLYASWGVLTPEVQKVLEAWRQPSGRTCRGGRYRAQVMNGSGRDDTSMLNVLLNGAAQYCAWSKVLLGRYPHQLTEAERNWLDQELRVAVMGDDSLTFVPRLRKDGTVWEDKEVISALAEFGFETKLQTCDNAWDAVFLGCRPYPVDRGLAWGPTLGRRLYKHHTMVWPSKADPYAWLKGVVRAEALQYAHVPILRGIAKHCLGLLARHAETPYEAAEWKWIEQRQTAVKRATPELEQAALLHVYGITRDMLQELTDLLAKVETLPFHLDCEAVDRCLTVDDL